MKKSDKNNIKSEPSQITTETKKKKREAKNEFRFNRATAHYDYVFEDDGAKYSSLGLTHSPKTFNKPNMPLEKNPRKNHTEKAYIRNGYNRKAHKYYGKIQKDFAFSPTDFANVKAKIRAYKKNRKKNK